jgi:SAM-dependent methyltransferase
VWTCIPVPGDGAVGAEDDKAALRGLPSYVWRFGQERRLALIDRYAPLAGRRVLDVGCGIGTYVGKLRQFSDRVYGIDVDMERVVEGGKRLPNLLVAAAENPPFAGASFDVILLHEVLEHVQDDRRVVEEAHRLLVPGGRMVIFAPNRLYPFETHGIYWRGQYRFGNFPLVGYLPTSQRDRLCPHVRTYTRGDLQRLLEGLECRLVVHTQIYPGYDNILARQRSLGSLLRRVTYLMEGTPLRLFGLSHLLVVEKPAPITASTSVR